MKIPGIKFHANDSDLGLFEIIDLSDLYDRSEQLNFNAAMPHRVDFHNLIVITGGKGEHYIDFYHYPVQAGSVIFVNTNQVHAFSFESRLQGKLLLFTKDFLDLLRVNIRVPVLSSSYSIISKYPVMNICADLSESVESLLKEMTKLSGHQPYDGQVLQLLFATLMLKLHSKGSNDHYELLSGARRKKFNQFLTLIEENFTTTKDSADYASMLGMTYKSLNQLCKIAALDTPKKIIDSYIVLEAKRRLAIENIQVTQLSFELGFDEVSNFVKYFKKHTQFTPAQFKNNVQARNAAAG